MHTFLLTTLCLLLLAAASYAQSPIAIVVHGGAGTISRDRMTPELEKAYRQKLEEALRKGYEILQNGGSSLDAVEASIQVLEESPLFNAGRGAVFTDAGTNELDASIMDGKTLNAGAVAGVRRIKSPIKAARAVMERSPHVMMIGEGAEAFARSVGLEMVKPDYFKDEKRYQQYLRAKQKSGKQSLGYKEIEKHGTVGCVALDKQGNLAAGTSTGGMMLKRFGRVGDSPIIGAGTYADNEACGVSATGWGEFFIRLAVAHDIIALMKYKGLGVQEAAQAVIDKVGQLGGDGGVIAMDRRGNIAMPFNTKGMYRGYIDTQGQLKVMIYDDEQ
jgi:beta-aspartyl-peptidase (threonine type)